MKPFLIILALSIHSLAYGQPNLRIATYNVYFGNLELDTVAAAITNANADIVLLQETTASLENFLKKKLSAQYPYMYFQGHQGDYRMERLGFLSRFRPAEIRFVPPQYGLFGSLIGKFETPAGPIQVANVHLNPVIFPPDASPAALFQAWSGSEHIRRQEIERIASGLNTHLSTIVAGDFNSFSHGFAPEFLRTNRFTDSFAAVHTNADQYPTWTSPGNSHLLRFRIDYIFHDASFKTMGSWIITNNSSDHFLVVSEVKK